MNEPRHVYVEAPDELIKDYVWKSVFLAGGITGCPNWQASIRGHLADSGLVLYNPRRSSFDINATPEREQIEWEYKALNQADAILFWFPAGESLCPIVLYELGTWTQKYPYKPIFIGIEPGYKRENDIRVQTELTRPTVPIVSSLEALASIVDSEMGRH
jgi:hypothetical protein